jgi:hypothetical protein
MSKINESSLVQAIKKSSGMDLVESEKVVDEIYLEQPNLLASVLVQNQMGNKIEDVEVLLNILIVTFLALKYSGVKIEKISEKTQEKELAKYTGHIGFLEGLNNKTTEVAIKQFTESKSEKALMAYVIETMLRAGFTKRKNENAKYLVMTGVNIVNCICVAKIA